MSEEMAATDDPRITRFIAGWMTAPAAVWRQGDPVDESVRFPVPAYLIEHRGERVLVDTGLDPAAIADPAAHYGQPELWEVFRLEQDASLADQLDLGPVSMVVLTHLHYDHAGGLAGIPDAVPVVVQRAEWEAGGDPTAIKRNFYFPRDYDVPDREIVQVEADHDLLGDGAIRLLLTPGHTPGHQSIQVGDLVIGADVAYYESGLDDLRFPPYGDDHAQQARSAERLRGLRDRGATVLPGHDPAVLTPGPVEARREVQSW